MAEEGDEGAAVKMLGIQRRTGLSLFCALALFVGLFTLGLSALGQGRAGAATVNEASFVSQTGDWLGQGGTYDFSTVTYLGLRNGYPMFDVSNGTDQFQAWFAAPAGQTLTTGTYTDAQRFDFRAAGHPGLDVFGDGRGCDTVAGSFTVYDISTDAGGAIQSFAAEFTDRCEGAVPALFGEISYNSDVTMPPLPTPSAPTAPVISNVPSFGRAGLSFVAQVSTNSDGTTSVVSSTSNVCEVGNDGLTVRYLSSGTCSLTPEVAASPDYLAASGAAQSFFISPVTGGAAPTPHGYWLVGSDGGIFSFGSAQFSGSMGGQPLQRPVVGIVPTADRGGYWLDASDGGVFSFGDTHFYGSIPGLGLHPAGSGLPNSLAAPIVGMVPSHDQGGYFMVASDGGVFAFGDATFAGSCPGIGGCTGKAVSVIPDSTGNGYWLVTTSGNVYAFGDAVNLGAPGPQPWLITSAVATPDGRGYWILDSDGAVFAYGDALNWGSPPATTFSSSNPANVIFATSDGGGYWVADARGGVFPFGDAPMDGDMSGIQLNGPIVGASGS